MSNRTTASVTQPLPVRYVHSYCNVSLSAATTPHKKHGCCALIKNSSLRDAYYSIRHFAPRKEFLVFMATNK